ncbi:MAG: T9SS type A sorting domain-containing protein [Bacteroidetes bacterium]|nr:MAG: T9SS type A sorting domain-containing protein [Bacteroidota bacterium]
MKNLITFLLYCLSVTALLAQAESESNLVILQAGPTETLLRLDLSSIDETTVQTPRGPASIIHIGDGTPLLQKGAPDVPKYSTILLIPNKGSMVVEVVASEYAEHQDVQIAPSKGNLKRTVNPANIPFEYGGEYTRNAFFPGALAELQTPFILREARGQALWIYPVQYNPVTRILRVYHSLTLRVRQDGNSGKNELAGGPVSAPSRAFDQLYQHLFVNAAQRVTDRSGSQEPDKMLVLAQDELLDALQPLITWRRRMGIHTTVVPMSEIGTSDASAVYAFVQNYYAEHGITYLLLAGDEYAIEPEMRSDGGLYSCDNCFGYMTGDDHFPEILVGRLHARNPEEMRIMVNRNLQYEINPLIDTTYNWMAIGMASASNEGAGVGDDNQADWEHANEWKTNHLADGFTEYWEFYDGSHGVDSPTPGDTTADKAGNPTNIPLVNLMNTRGVSLYNYTGHGWEQGLVSGNFTNNAVQNLRNPGRYPILISVACCTGNFTNGDCLGEAWQRAGDPATGEAWGGIAGFFSSDFQSWSPPMEGQDGMNQYLADADGITLTPSIAGMLAFGNAKMIAAYGIGGEVMADFWNPFTEPATIPRTAMPQAILASHADSTAFETTSLLVSCPVEGALVSLYWKDQTKAVAIVENGIATLEFAPFDNIGEAQITVTQFNHLPYMGTVVVRPAVQPFVIHQQILLDDSAANNNQKADYGETLNLNVLLRNVGLGLATGIQATLETDNPYVTLSSNQVQTNDLYSSDSTVAVFTFSVSNAVPNGTKAYFTLDLIYNDSLHFSADIPVTLFAPALEVGSWSINDTQGGNGNGRFESGETIELRILNRNTGGSASPDAIGSLASPSPYLTVSAPADLPPMTAISGTEEAVFYLTVAPDAPASLYLDLSYSVAAGNYSTFAAIGPLVLNPIVETFETNDFNSFNWAFSGNKPWTVTPNGAYAGTYCSRSGTITHNQESAMHIELLVQEDGLVSFARRVSSEADFDFLYFYLDGVQLGAWSGETPWGEVSYPVSAGQHTLAWIYQKDQLVSDGADRAWVDEIMLPPHQIVVGTQDKFGPAAASVTVQPNPATGPIDILVDLEEEQPVEVAVLDYLGRTVQTVQQTKRLAKGLHRFTADLGTAPPGIYLVIVRGKNALQTAKVVLTRG